MRATEFEFRQRFWIIGLIYAAGFSLATFDHNLAGSAVANWFGLPQTDGLHLAFGCGAVIALAGAAIRTWAAAYLESDVVHDQRLHSERLVADGPYRFVRNPLYLGVILLTAGMGLLASRIGWIIMMVGITLFQYRLTKREEQMLASSLGESYIRYRDAVPNLIPSLSPRLPSSGRAPRWGQAFRGEAFIWTFATSLALLAITLEPALAYVCMALGFALYFVLKRNHGNTN
jgi:protein-S-isoprenylcysteine O-methyltransferase Ste14